MLTGKVTSIGDSIGIVLPPEAVARLQVADGDDVVILETATGIQLNSCRNLIISQLDVAKAVMIEDHDVLQKLAE